MKKKLKNIIKRSRRERILLSIRKLPKQKPFTAFALI